MASLELSAQITLPTKRISSWQKFARQGLGTNNLDHHRTGDLSTFFDALSGKNGAFATTADLYTAKSVLAVGADLSQQHPFLAFQTRANVRHHAAHVYVVSAGPVREDHQAVASVRVEKGGELSGVESLRDKLKTEENLVIAFGDAFKGDALRNLVAFGDSLGIPVKYVCLVDYSNSRGAFDMGVIPGNGGMSLRTDAGFSPISTYFGSSERILLKNAALAAKQAFVVVQDLFMTETAKRADIVLPAASAYEKSGTVTNVCGEVQKLKQAIKVMGAKTDLEICGLIAKEMGLNLGIWLPDKMLRRNPQERTTAITSLCRCSATGGAAQTAPLNGRSPRCLGDPSAGDTLFTSGTLSAVLQDSELGDGSARRSLWRPSAAKEGQQ